MAQRQGCCSCFGKGRERRVEPEGHEPVILRNDQIEPAPTRDLPKPPKNTENEPTTLSPPARLQQADSGGKSRLGEGLEGRINTIPDEEFREQNGALRIQQETDEKATKLITKAINFHHEENRKAHRTDDYEIQELIIRRGQTFEITVTFNREYNPQDDVIIVQFVTGNRPQESKGSIMRVAIQDELTPTKWGMQVKETKGNDVSLSIMPASKAIIGQYELFVETKSKDSSGEIAMSRYQDKKPIYLLFNAWCQEDAVYMESDEHRKEYVLEDFGFIWKGVSTDVSPSPWAFDQFEDVALYSALWLLDKAKLFSHNRTSPVEISRTISAMSNSNNADGGVLSGRWSNKYPEGTTDPLDWTGSGPILEEFWTTKKTVKYGQCWVFSGLVTTLMRALGIPTRSVTNFDSAHDTDASMTIDYHFNGEGDMIHDMNDSVWNFHVWNESWFRRPDLPLGHDGWQVYDATPQETSQGVFRCGPASVKAVKKGEVYLPYDTGFVFAEVNGDRVYWDVNTEDGSMKPTNVSKKSIGSFVSTKAVGSNSRDDITQEYKYPEGSDEERKAVHLAFQFSSRTEQELYDTSVVEDVQFRLETEDRIDPGQSFEVTVVVKNNSEVTREIKVNLAAVLDFYTGVPAKKMNTYKLKFLLNSNAEQRLSLTIEPSDYITPKATVGDSYVQLYVKGVVPETGQSFVDQKMVGFTKQKIHIEPSANSAKVGDEVELTGIFKNPLPVPLTKGHFLVQATRMKPRTIRFDCKGPVGVNEDARFSAKFTVARKGCHRISARFNSTELKDVPGDCEILGSD